MLNINTKKGIRVANSYPRNTENNYSGPKWGSYPFGIFRVFFTINIIKKVKKLIFTFRAEP